VYTLGTGDVVQVAPVTPGDQLDSVTLVKGLEPGTRVVIDGLQSVRPGDTVHVRMLNQ
jgi:multidrug efflux pump subunit AcrA (membrane-fusion protein)